jgi:hypothetical protein
MHTHPTLQPAHIACPKCAATVPLPRGFLFWMKAERSIACKRCGEGLAPLFHPAKGLIFYGLFGAHMMLAVACGRLCPPETIVTIPLVFLSCCGYPLERAWIDRHCTYGVGAHYEGAAENQFSLLQALYAMLVAAAMLAVWFAPEENLPRVAMCAYAMWGLLEMARYVSIKRSRGAVR